MRRQVTTAADGRGIDLAVHWIDVKRITTKRFGRAAERAGIEIDDLVQEASRKVLASNAGSNPYDPARVTLGSFVFMVAQSALRNLIRDRRRIKSHEQIGLPDPIDPTVTLDVALVASDEAEESADEVRARVCSDIASAALLDPTERDLLGLLSEGYTAAEIVQVMEPEGVTRKQLADLRIWLREFGAA